MSVTTTVKKVVTDQTYATLGATDLTVETVRGYGQQLAALRAELEPTKVRARVKAAPADAQTYYAGLTERGQALVTRIREQQATRDLVGQAESTVALGKGVLTTVRKAVGEVERSAKATLTTGRKEAVAAAEAVADSVDVDIDVTVDAPAAKKAVATSAKRTTTAAKRTSTTTKKAATRTRTAAKSAGTSARKTAAKSVKAADKAADKVGD